MKLPPEAQPSVPTNPKSTPSTFSCFDQTWHKLSTCSDANSLAGDTSETGIARNQALYRAKALFAIRVMAMLADHYVIYPHQASSEEKAFIAALTPILQPGSTERRDALADPSGPLPAPSGPLTTLRALANLHPLSPMAHCLGQALDAIQFIQPNERLDNRSTDQGSFLRDLFHLDTRFNRAISAVGKEGANAHPFSFEKYTLMSCFNESVTADRVTDYLAFYRDGHHGYFDGTP